MVERPSPGQTRLEGRGYASISRAARNYYGCNERLAAAAVLVRAAINSATAADIQLAINRRVLDAEALEVGWALGRHVARMHLTVTYRRSGDQSRVVRRQ
jgi:hypothetical protein